MSKVIFEFDMDKDSDVKQYQTARISTVYRECLTEVVNYINATSKTNDNAEVCQELKKIEKLIDSFVDKEELN
jgi:hypothetical protein